MNTFIASLKNVFNLSLATAADHEEAYLAQAADLADLELRMREIDERHRSVPVDGPYGLFIR